MTTQATGTIEAKSWDDEPDGESGTRLSRVIATNHFTLDIEVA